MISAREFEPIVRIVLFALGGYFQGQEEVINILNFVQADPEVISLLAISIATIWYAIAKWTNSPR